jgi:hypothetical protein
MCLYQSDDLGLTWSGPMHPQPWPYTLEYGVPIEYDSKCYLLWAEVYDPVSLAAVLHWRDVSDVIS